MLVNGCDYFVRYVDLPTKVGGCTYVNPDGTYDIYVNRLLPEPKQKKAIKHEFVHILDDHFYRDDLSPEEKEWRADNAKWKEESDVSKE